MPRMPRPPKKVKPGTGLVNFSFLLDAELAHEVDSVAEQMRKEDPLQRAVTRTDALRALIRTGIAAYRRGK